MHQQKQTPGRSTQHNRIRKAEPAMQPASPPAMAQILQMQRTLGNRATSQLLRGMQNRPPAQMFGGIFGFEPHKPEVEASVATEVEKQQQVVKSYIDEIKSAEKATKKSLEDTKNQTILDIDSDYSAINHLKKKEVKESLFATRDRMRNASATISGLINEVKGVRVDIRKAIEEIKPLKFGPERKKKQQAIDALRLRETALNQDIDRAGQEKENLRVQCETLEWQLDGLNDRDSRRREYLRRTYVPRLRQIGITPHKLNMKLRKPLSMVKSGDEHHVKMNEHVIYKIYTTGEKAFEPLKEQDAEWKRTVYVKKGTDKQYVKDDRDVFTRRFAYAEKGAKQVENTLDQNQPLKGRFIAKGIGTSIFDKSAASSDRYEFGTMPTEPMSVPEMLFVHQEMGSTDEQRGVSISSTSKLIHGNAGDTFKSSGGYNLEIDLAKVPTGEHNLYNLYSEEARKHVIGLADGEYSAESSKNHTNDSTSKNRELFLRELKTEYLATNGKRKNP